MRSMRSKKRKIGIRRERRKTAGTHLLTKCMSLA